MTRGLEHEITGARRALQTVRAAMDGGEAAAALDAALEELTVAIEELEVSSEELELQQQELLATRAELEQEERSYRELFELAPDAYLVTDADGRIEEANRAAAGLLGVPRHLLEGRVLATFIEPESRTAFRRRLLELRRGGSARDWELPVRPRRSPVVVVAADVDPARDAGGACRALRWVLRDVTDARRAQQALQQAFATTSEEYAQLREVDRWKDAFLAAAAHDLRSPLAVISMGLETLAATPEAVDVAATAERLRDHSDRLVRLLNDLLDLDRLTRGAMTAERSPTDILALVEGVVAHVHPDDHAVEVMGTSVTVEVDPLRVEQIVQNLVLNAFEHTPGGTAVRVQVLGDGGGATVIVEDEGPGVPEEVRDDLLLPFVTAPSHPEDSRGTGIGLSLVNLFAQLHGGQVRVEDRDGGGARFVVVLPGATRA